MTWLAIAACVLAQGVAAPTHGVVLVLPLEAKSPALTESSDLITTVVAAEMRKQSALTVVTLRDLEGSLNLEMKKQLAGCGSASCAAEIAGALNTDEVVLGSMGSVGSGTMVVGLTRMKAGSAQVLGSATRVIKSSDPGAVLEEVPAMVGELLRVAPPSPPGPAVVTGKTPSSPRPPSRAGPVSQDHVEIDQFMQPSQGPDHAELSWPSFYATVGHPELASAYLARVTLRWSLYVGGLLVMVASAFALPAAALLGTGGLLGWAYLATFTSWTLPSLGGTVGPVVAGTVLLLLFIGLGTVAMGAGTAGGLGMIYGGYGMATQPVTDEEIRGLVKEHNREVDAPPSDR